MKKKVIIALIALPLFILTFWAGGEAHMRYDRWVVSFGSQFETYMAQTENTAENCAFEAVPPGNGPCFFDVDGARWYELAPGEGEVWEQFTISGAKPGISLRKLKSAVCDDCIRRLAQACPPGWETDGLFLYDPAEDALTPLSGNYLNWSRDEYTLLITKPRKYTYILTYIGLPDSLA